MIKLECEQEQRTTFGIRSVNIETINSKKLCMVGVAKIKSFVHQSMGSSRAKQTKLQKNNFESKINKNAKEQL